MSLAELYATYLDSKREFKERDPHRLFVTDLGKCGRQVAYRLLQTPKNPKLDETKMNETIMFDLAEHLETTLGFALEDNDMFVAEQKDVPMPDRENWGGRLDFIADYNGRRIIEVKSVRSNKFNYADELPDHAHELQAAVYDHYIREEGVFVLDAPPLLWYVDRGGSNTPLEFEVEYDWEEIAYMMDRLDSMREVVVSGGDLPDRLEKVLKLRSYGKKIVLEPPWQCGWCDYSDVCSPDMRKQDWANFDKSSGIWTPTGRAEIVRLTAFATKMTNGKVGGAF